MNDAAKMILGDATKLLTVALQNLQAGRAQGTLLYAQIASVQNPAIPAPYRLMAIVAEHSAQKQRTFRLQKRCTVLQPENSDDWRRLSNILSALGLMAAGLAAAKRSSVAAPANAQSYLSIAERLGAGGEHSDLPKIAKRAALLGPEILEIYPILANLAPQERAAQYFKKLILLAPHRLDACQQAVFEMRRQNINRLLDWVPALGGNLPDLCHTLAEHAEIDNDLDSCLALIDRCLAVDPGHSAGRVLKAKYFRRRKKFEDAVALLQSVGPDEGTADVQIRRNFELGALNDALGHYGDAFVAYRRANALVSGGEKFRTFDPSLFHQQIAYEELALKKSARSFTDFSYPPDDGVQPVFLVGFSRSGTTLLDRVLAGHPDISVMEEVSYLSHAYNQIVVRENQPGGSTEGLSPGDVSDLRAGYQAQVMGLFKGRVQVKFVDKMPFNMTVLRAAVLMFKRPKVIISIRNPLDVILSNFMQNFTLGPINANLFDLQNIFVSYQKVMALWEVSKDVLPIDVHEVRYENLVSDFDGEVSGVLDFIGVPWTDEVRNYTADKGNRHGAQSSSYAQVNQPVYSSSLERWRNYEGQLRPFIPLVQGQMDTLGYSSK